MYLPMLHPVLGTAAVDVVVIGVLTYFFVQLVAKPLISLRIDPTGHGFDAAVPSAAVVVAAVLITLDMYFPTAFAVVAMSVSVATGGVGFNRISKTNPAPPVPPAPPPLVTP